MVRIVQCLCPARHCILGFAYIPGVTTARQEGVDGELTLTEANAAAYLRHMVGHLAAAGALNAHCGICLSKDLRYEDGLTRFKTMAEAAPEIERRENENLIARKVLRAREN